MAKQLNRMTQSNYFKLCTWLSQQTLTQSHTREGLAKEASLHLGLELTTANIKAALETCEMGIPGAPLNSDQKLNVIGAALVSLYARLNEPVPKELAALAQK